ncbi:serine protease [Modestobacter sp. I12A-02628]|uniref:S8/S53 family peptidase n=1 Tax=Goekera deserti TaxID=2497753 RepID=A0A7K3WCF5_9ACTN|nr:S53 family peptidase [Goekera deserti]MPQ98469.1 serine protease [Goekera deserti]NDI48298.1 serine protease [Goekera deserti]NEL54047.1 S8/S53 family peptidase [Goekera deserti]
MRRSTRLTALTGAVCLALAVGSVSAATGALAAPSRGALPTSVPSWATASALRGAAPAGDVVHARVYLPWRDQAGLDALATAVSTPGSPSYGQYLSPQQFRSRFAPSQQDVAAVQQWLRSAGFSIADTPDNGHYVAVEGTVAQAQAAFGTTLGLYSTHGRTLRAPESAPSVPAALAGTVSAVVGLDDGATLLAPDSTTGNGNGNAQSNGKGNGQTHGAPGVGFRAGQPCASYYGSSTVTTSSPVYGDTSTPLAPCGYTPAQVRGLYGLTPGDTGAGQTVAFVGANASPTIVQDVTRYSSLHGLPAPSIQQQVAPGTYRHPDTPRQTPGDFYGEQTLDAEAIHTMAPDATLLYVGSANAGQDFDASINAIVDKHLAATLSISYGFSGEQVPQGFVTSLSNTFEEAVATGVGVFVSSGDSGDEVAATGVAQPDFYADSPYVTAVGGTSAAVVPTAGTAPLTSDSPLFGNAGGNALTAAANWTRGFETGWQTSQDALSGTIARAASGAPTYTADGTLAQPLPAPFTGGAGGGVSTVFAKPAYQSALPGSGRLVPDISALADPNTGFLVGQTQQFTTGVQYDEYRIGGTSLAAPLMAGLAAVADQRAGHALGFLNPRIYAVYAGTPSALYDVDQSDLSCGGRACTAADPLPAVVRVNYTDSESAAGGLTLSVRTQETPLTTLHTVRGYDTGSGVGTPDGDAFLAALLR